MNIPDGAVMTCFSERRREARRIFRSGILANKTGLSAEGLGAKTKWWFWPNAYVRECAGFFSNRKMLILYLAILLVTGAITAQMTNIMF